MRRQVTVRRARGFRALGHRLNTQTQTQRVARKLALFSYALTLPNINRFSQLFHCQNKEKTCNNTIAEDPTTPQVGRYALPCEMSSVLKARAT